MTEASEVVLMMERCNPRRLVPNTIMLCTRNVFMLENMRDISIHEYTAILKGSGNAGIIKE